MHLTTSSVLFSLLGASGLVTAAALVPRSANGRVGGYTCGAHAPPNHPNIARNAHRLALSHGGKNGEDWNITIPVVFTVIACSEAELEDIPEDALEAQFAQTYNSFAPYGIFWELQDIQRKVFAEKCVLDYEGAEGGMREMKAATRVGTMDTANVWIVKGEVPLSLLGFATFPKDGETEGDEDGVVVAAETLPGNPGFNGGTLVHELGHWLDLWHTFEGGCNGQGDGVSDTPAMDYGHTSCAAAGATGPQPDSCPNSVGLDPVNNFMSYSPDACLNEFTPGQVLKMKTAWTVFREGN